MTKIPKARTRAARSASTSKSAKLVKSAPAKPSKPVSARAVTTPRAPGAAKANARRKAEVPSHKRKAVKKNTGRSFETKLVELKGRLREIGDLNFAGAVLNWDQATYMPAGGATARGRQGAMLSRLAHERSIDPQLGRLLDDLAATSTHLPLESDDRSLVRVARRDFEKALRVPADYVERSSQHGSASFDAWTRAKPANDFETMRPFLEKSVALAREYAGFFKPYLHIPDPMIDDYDAGMTTDSVRAMFTDLRRELVPIVRAICGQEPADDACLHGTFSEPVQLDLGNVVIRRLGYDFERGRIDKTHHPFCTKFSAGDVRITTRVDEADIGQALFSTIHESGHAMYEQGVGEALADTPLGSGTSAGVHESQSRLWENIVGRGPAFWEFFYPMLQAKFPFQFRDVPIETFYRAINKVQRSLIRTDADEVTYNLHVMMRFDLEVDLLQGKLAVKDLPEAWRARMKQDLGLVPPTDREGCLQDVHWFSGGIGGSFQGYTIGNVLSAQFYAAALKEHPDIPEEMLQGRFGKLHGWLKENIYRHGRKFQPNELVKQATGEVMSIAPYVTYLRGKYGDLYRLPTEEKEKKKPAAEKEKKKKAS